MKPSIASELPSSNPSDPATDMVLRIFKIARLLERAAAPSEEGRLSNATSENHESQDSRYGDRERDLS